MGAWCVAQQAASSLHRSASPRWSLRRPPPRSSSRISGGSRSRSTSPTRRSPAIASTTATTLTTVVRKPDPRVTVDDNYFDYTDRLNVQLGYWRFRLSVRLDGQLYGGIVHQGNVVDHVIAETERYREPLDSTRLIDRSNEYLAEVNTRFRAGLYPAKLSLAYQQPGLDITAGDFYAQLGRGLVLSVRKLDELATDTTIRGGKVQASKTFGSFRRRRHPPRRPVQPAARGRAVRPHDLRGRFPSLLRLPRARRAPAHRAHGRARGGGESPPELRARHRVRRPHRGGPHARPGRRQRGGRPARRSKSWIQAVYPGRRGRSGEVGGLLLFAPHPQHRDGGPLPQPDPQLQRIDHPASARQVRRPLRGGRRTAARGRHGHRGGRARQHRGPPARPRRIRGVRQRQRPPRPPHPEPRRQAQPPLLRPLRQRQLRLHGSLRARVLAALVQRSPHGGAHLRRARRRAQRVQHRRPRAGPVPPRQGGRGLRLGGPLFELVGIRGRQQPV
jgi:hypothetical protein